MTSIKDKADHVRAAHQTRVHRCHWPGCQTLVPPAKWGCAAHWFRLPLVYRNRIWGAYRVGQEADLTPSREYLAVAREVQQWIKEQG